MPAIAAISTNDGGPSGGRAFVFEPVSITGNMASWLDQTPGVPLAYSKLTASISRPSKTNHNSKTRIRLEVPVMVATPASGSPEVSHIMIADVTFTSSELATDAERQSLLGVFNTLLTNAEGTLGFDMFTAQLQQY
jgi:hypothetical protein